jgi:alpha-N-acetylglucosaminidase
MQSYYPGSTWVLQGWQDNPKQAMLDGLDKSKVLVQELFGEFTNNWEKRKAYDNTPFIWCSVNNFGERPGVYGKLQRFADETYRARQSTYSSYLKGVGIMPEGINNNPPDYDLMLELGWRKEHVDTKKWINDYAKYRYGINVHAGKAWQGFCKQFIKAFRVTRKGQVNLFFAQGRHLKLNRYPAGVRLPAIMILYKFENAVKEFAKASPCTYKFGHL